MNALPLTTEMLDLCADQNSRDEIADEQAVQAVLESSFSHNPEEHERVSDALTEILSSAEGTPVMLRTSAGIIVGYTSHALYDSPVVIQQAETSYTFTVCLERGLVCPYNKQDPVFEIDDTDDYIEIQFAGLDQRGNPVQPEVWVGAEAIVRSPALDFEPDMIAVFRHIGIYSK